MLRKLVLVFLVSGVFAAPAAWALGLGEIHVSSSLNQPFEASVPILTLEPGEAETLKVRLAANADFERLGLERAAYLSSLKFNVIANDNPRLTIRSSEIAREPLLVFLVEAVSGGVRVLREYSVLLDPAQARLPTPPAVARTPAPLPQAAPAPRLAPRAIGVARPGAASSSAANARVVARGPSPATVKSPIRTQAVTDPIGPPVVRYDRPAPVSRSVSRPASSAPVVSARPPARAASAGSRDYFLTPEELAALPPAPTDTTPRAPAVRTSTPTSSGGTSAGAFDDGSYGPVRSGQTLSIIAREVRGSRTGISLPQVSLALYESNPDAFAGGDINRLRKGATLNVPTAAEMSAVSESAARRQLRAIAAGEAEPAYGQPVPPQPSDVAEVDGPETSGNATDEDLGDVAQAADDAESAVLAESDEASADVAEFSDQEVAEPSDNTVEEVVSEPDTEAKLPASVDVASDTSDTVLTETDDPVADEVAEPASELAQEAPIEMETLSDNGDSRLLAAILGNQEAGEEPIWSEWLEKLSSTAAELGLDPGMIGLPTSDLPLTEADEHPDPTDAAFADEPSAAGDQLPADDESTPAEAPLEAAEGDDTLLLEEAFVDESEFAQPGWMQTLEKLESYGVKLDSEGFGRALGIAGLVILALIALLCIRAWRAGRATRQYERAARSVERQSEKKAKKLQKAEKKASKAEPSPTDEQKAPAPPKLEHEVAGPGIGVTAGHRMGAATLAASTMAEPGGAAPEDSASLGLTDTHQLEVENSDPLAEADFHIAYGLYDEAALLLKQAAEKEPDRSQLRVKLAETYFAAGKPGEFLQVAEGLKPELAAQEWQKLAIMGQQICPDAEIFGSASTQAEVGPVDLPVEEDAPAAQHTEDDNVLEFDMPLQAPNLEQAPAPEPSQDKTDDAFDLSEFDLGPSTRPEQLSDAADVTKELDEEQFTLDEAPRVRSPGGASGVDGPSAFEHGDVQVEELQLQVEDSEPAPISAGDEIGTKLDLARAYVEMSDEEMARSLLEEVVEQGSVSQKQEAENLLRRLGA